MSDDLEWLRHVINPEPPLFDKSKVTVACSVCNEAIKISVKQLKYRVRRDLPIRCRSCSIKDLWNKPGFRDKISQEKIWSNPDLRNRISEKSKKLWKKPEYIALQVSIHEDEEYLRQTKLRSKELWENEEFRSRQEQIRSNPEWIRKQSDSMKAIWERPEYKKKLARSLSKVFVKGFRSSIEVITKNILTDSSIKFNEQEPVGPYLFDFFLPEHNIYIECQGEYWHSINNGPSRDSAKRSYLEQSSPDSKLICLHERDFLNPGIVRQKLSLFIFGETKRNQLIDFSFNEINITKLDSKLKRKKYRSIAQEFLDSYHYAQFGRSAKIVYGAFLGDELIAICKFSTPVRVEVATSLNLGLSEVLELDRFCIHPNYHKRNFASWLLSRCKTAVFTEFTKINCIVSFSDSTYGHRGTIYRATNWTEVSTVPADYYYVNQDGWILHKKTLYNHASRNKMTERNYAEEHGYSKVFGKEKTKFIVMRTA